MASPERALGERGAQRFRQPRFAARVGPSRQRTEEPQDFADVGLVKVCLIQIILNLTQICFIGQSLNRRWSIAPWTRKPFDEVVRQV
jgi:hypothetical protein